MHIWRPMVRCYPIWIQTAFHSTEQNVDFHLARCQSLQGSNLALHRRDSGQWREKQILFTVNNVIAGFSTLVNKLVGLHAVLLYLNWWSISSTGIRLAIMARATKIVAHDISLKVWGWYEVAQSLGMSNSTKVVGYFQAFCKECPVTIEKETRILNIFNLLNLVD